ncbi:hypothetical protein ACFLTZ_00675 [Chloroflexota bacterium]
MASAADILDYLASSGCIITACVLFALEPVAQTPPCTGRCWFKPGRGMKKRIDCSGKTLVGMKYLKNSKTGEVD